MRFRSFGKARFLDMQLYSTLLPYAVAALEDFHSHALMCIAWALARVLIKCNSAITQVCSLLLNTKPFVNFPK